MKTQEFPDISDKPEAMLVSKVMHTYTDTARSLGVEVDWSVFDCIYDSLIEAMRKMLSLSPEQLRKMGKKGRELMLRKFDEKIIMAEYKKALKTYA